MNSVIVLIAVALCSGHVAVGFQALQLPQRQLSLEPEIVRTAINFVLENQGTSPDELERRLSEAGGDVGNAVNIFNSELHSNLLSIENDKVQANPDELISLAKGAVGSFLRNNLASQPILAIILNQQIGDLLKNRRGEIENILAASAVPVDVAQALLSNIGNLRSKRATAQAQDVITDVIWDVVFGGGANTEVIVVISVLDQVINLLQSYIVATPPTGELQSLIVYVQNTVIKFTIQQLVAIQLQINSTVSVNEAAVRRKRAAETTTVATVAGGGGIDIWAIITNPIGAILGFILQPIKALLENYISTALDQLACTLGGIVTSPVQDAIFGVIDSVIP